MNFQIQSFVIFNEFVNPLNLLIQYIKLIQNLIIWKSKSETQLYNFFDKPSNENVTPLRKTELQCTLWNTSAAAAAGHVDKPCSPVMLQRCLAVSAKWKLQPNEICSRQGISKSETNWSVSGCGIECVNTTLGLCVTSRFCMKFTGSKCVKLASKSYWF